MKNKKIFISIILFVTILLLSTICQASTVDYDISDYNNYIDSRVYAIVYSKENDCIYLILADKYFLGVDGVETNYFWSSSTSDACTSGFFHQRMFGITVYTYNTSTKKFENMKSYGYQTFKTGKDTQILAANTNVGNADNISTLFSQKEPENNTVSVEKERGTDTEPNPGTDSGEGSDTGTDENNNSWLSKIFNSIGNIGSSILEGLEVPFNTIKEGLDNIFKTISNIVSFLNPSSDNFFGKKLIELFTDLFKYLFVPSENPFTSLSDKFEGKFQIINQIKNLISSLLGNFDYGDSIPEFKITYLGASASIIDFSLFVEYRGWIHGIILAIAWYSFLIRLFKKLPGIIGGFNNDN